MYNIRIFS